MKRLATYLVFLAICLLSVNSGAAQQLFGSLSPVVTNPTNSAVVMTNNASVTVGQIQISYGDLGITNAFNGYLLFSVDKTNTVRIGPIFRPANTNASQETIRQQTVTVPIYFQMSVATNSWNTATPAVGGGYTQPQ